jgi:hypothetical protein
MKPRSKVKAVSTSRSTLTCVVRTPAGAGAGAGASATISWPPRRITSCVRITPLAPIPTAALVRSTIGTSSPAVGDGGVAAASSGARVLTAPSTSMPPVLLPDGRAKRASPSRSPSTARNSAVTSHDARSSAMRRRTRKAHTPSCGLVRAGSVRPPPVAATRCSAAVCTSNSP